MVVLRRAAAVEAAVAVAVPGEGYLGRVMPVAADGEGEDGGEAAAPGGGGGGSGSSGGATALVPAPRYRRLRPSQDPLPPPTAPGQQQLLLLQYAPVLLHCRWGGQPGPLAAILAPAPTDYRAWRGEQAEAAARRKTRAAAVQAAAETRAAASVASLLLSVAVAAAAQGEKKAAMWGPTARPAALPQGAAARLSLGAVTSAGFALGDGHAVAHGLVAVEALRRMQAGAARGVPAPMAGLVLVKDARSGRAYPASLHLWC